MAVFKSKWEDFKCIWEICTVYNTSLFTLLLNSDWIFSLAGFMSSFGSMIWRSQIKHKKNNFIYLSKFRATLQHCPLLRQDTIYSMFYMYIGKPIIKTINKRNKENIEILPAEVATSANMFSTFPQVPLWGFGRMPRTWHMIW